VSRLPWQLYRTEDRPARNRQRLQQAGDGEEGCGAALPIIPGVYDGETSGSARSHGAGPAVLAAPAGHHDDRAQDSETTGGTTGLPAEPVPSHRLQAEGPPVVVAWLQAPCFAAQFLTVLPALVRRPPHADDLGRSEAFFPLIGLLLGAIVAGADLLLQPVASPLVRDVMVVALLAGLTGALHLDGLIDTFDGLFAGRSPERRLEIMRDPRAGAFGVVTVVLLLALKLAALASLPADLRIAALVIAPGLGRWAIVLVTATFPYARPEGMGRAFKASIKRRHVVVAGALALGAAGAVVGAGGIVVWLAASAAALLAGRWVTSRLGGVTGDVYGAICELVEAGVLVALGLQIWSRIG
jgi:adenosylcobinamide-GDP ribazoletransferase